MSKIVRRTLIKGKVYDEDGKLIIIGRTDWSAVRKRVAEAAKMESESLLSDGKESEKNNTNSQK